MSWFLLEAYHEKEFSVHMSKRGQHLEGEKKETRLGRGRSWAAMQAKSALAFPMDSCGIKWPIIMMPLGGQIAQILYLYFDQPSLGVGHPRKDVTLTLTALSCSVAAS